MPAAAPLTELQRALGYRFHQRERLLQALTHRSFGRQPGTHPSAVAAPGSDNERLEFLGDAVLALCVSERLIEAFPASPEGELTKLRSWIVSARSLAAAAARLELGRHLRLSRAEEAIGGRDKQRLLANAFEAVIAAIYLDGGLEPAAAFVQRHLLAAALESASPHDLHEFAYKSALQEWAHAHARPLPVYRLCSASGPEHTRTFTVEVALPEVFAGVGPSKKAAEQAAAKAALVFFGLAPE